MGEVIQLGARQTGPRTAAGKRRSSLNALKTGVYSKAVVVRGVEDPSEFESLVKSVIAYHEIEDPVLMLAAERFIAIAWRLRRVRRVEAEKLSLRGREHVRASADLQELRDELDRLVTWNAATTTVLYGKGAVASDVVEAVREGAEYLFNTSDLKSHGIPGAIEFDSDQLMRIEAAERPVRRRTVNAALENARRALPEGLARENLREFLWGIVNAFIKREADQRSLIEQQERAALETFIGAHELRWEDARSLSDAERRLDAQFTRALSDFHAARRMSIAEAPSLPGAQHRAVRQ